MNNFFKITLIFGFLLFSSCLFAQIDVAPKVEKNGKWYYEHVVEKGETAYGLSKMYDVPIEAFYDDNPSAVNGLKIGQKLYFFIEKSGSVDTTESADDNPNSNISVNNQVDANPDDSTVIHVVKQGETMYAIAKKYGITIDKLLAANKEGGASIKPGDKVAVPITSADKNNTVLPIIKTPINPSIEPGDSVILHKVQKKETLYSISKQYDVSIDEILEANDGLEDGLKKNSIIKIIVPKTVPVIEIVSDSLFEVTQDTLKKDTLTLEQKETYNVAVMLPFMFAENDAFRKKCPPIGDCPFYGYTTMSLGIYNGFMLAVDSLKKAGFNVNIYTYDTENNETVTAEILKKPEFGNMDMIFGPLYAKQIKLTATYAKMHNVQNIIPVPVSNKALYKNPNISKAVVSNPTQVCALADYVAKKHANDNIIVMRNTGNKKDEYYYNTFKDSCNAKLLSQPLRFRDTVYPSGMSSSSSSKLKSIQYKLQADKLNVIVVPTTELAFASNFITKLSGTTNSNPYSKYQYVVYGLDKWRDFESIDEKYKNRYNLTMPVSNYIDYTSAEIQKFIKTYRLKYGYDPDDKTINSFDAAFNNLKGLYLYGVNYKAMYDHLDSDGYSFDTDYKQVDAESGFENQSVRIVGYENNRLVLKK